LIENASTKIRENTNATNAIYSMAERDEIDNFKSFNNLSMISEIDERQDVSIVTFESKFELIKRHLKLKDHPLRILRK
jgi:hypothetical protein